jgi:mRNA interferase MazF
MVRGEVLRLAASRHRRGHEQRGARYAVVVHSDDVSGLSTVLVAPTSRSARPGTFRPIIELRGATTRVLADQMTAVDPQRLGKSVGRLDAAELGAVDEALAVVLGL